MQPREPRLRALFRVGVISVSLSCTGEKRLDTLAYSRFDNMIESAQLSRTICCKGCQTFAIHGNPQPRKRDRDEFRLGTAGVPGPVCAGPRRKSPPALA